MSMQALSYIFGDYQQWYLTSTFNQPYACDFFFWWCLKDKEYNSNSWTEELKENIHREIANIPAEQLQRVNQDLFLRCENVYM
jgi:hypothetical protein